MFEDIWGKWVEWGGGHCPVSVYADVVVRLRSGTENSSRGCNFRWSHHGGLDDIVAYRVQKTAEELEADNV
jgi:hypothetical protein